MKDALKLYEGIIRLMNKIGQPLNEDQTTALGGYLSAWPDPAGPISEPQISDALRRVQAEMAERDPAAVQMLTLALTGCQWPTADEAKAMLGGRWVAADDLTDNLERLAVAIYGEGNVPARVLLVDMVAAVETICSNVHKAASALVEALGDTQLTD